jgi:hypothetical protein
MNTSALITMISAMGVVIFMTTYYFVKVLRTPVKNPKEDSYEDTN